MEWLINCKRIATELAVALLDDHDEGSYGHILIDTDDYMIKLIIQVSKWDAWETNTWDVLTAKGNTVEEAAVALENAYKLYLKEEARKKAEIEAAWAEKIKELDDLC